MFLRTYKKGWVEVITGTMFAGKSTELIRRLDTLNRAGEKIQIFSPEIDDRYGKNNIANHNGFSWPAEDVKDSKDLWSKLKDDTNVAVIDEIQFFDFGIVQTIEKLANAGVRVIVAGISQDFRGQPFKNMMHIMARAEFITKLKAVCMVCKAPATKIQRLTDGKPSSANEKTINIHADDIYEARCRHCHVVKDYDPNKWYDQ